MRASTQKTLILKSVDNSLDGVGIGLRHRHFEEILKEKPTIPWLEVHPENFFSRGSAAAWFLDQIREHYPLSGHCIGMSLGSVTPVAETHLNQVKYFVESFRPVLLSDHLSWSGAEGTYLPDLLPLPYTEEALDAICSNIDRAQHHLNRQILIENPSSYLSFTHSTIPEQEFFVEVAKRSGCGLLLDINNIYVSAHNHNFDAQAYLAAIPTELVQEIHLAGFNSREVESKEVYIDDHGARVHDPVWALFAHAAQRFAHIPTLIEWDTNVPELSVLLEEKHKAEEIIDKVVCHPSFRSGI